MFYTMDDAIDALETMDGSEDDDGYDYMQRKMFIKLKALLTIACTPSFSVLNFKKKY